MNIRPYVQLARPSHWLKNAFMVPGILIAVFFRPGLLSFDTVGGVLLGLVSACLTASSNYVLNEILDAERDRHHPDKGSRPLASGEARKSVAYVLWLVLALAGVGLGFLLNVPFGLACLALWGMGLLYNVPPIRLKDQPYLDVLSEAVNNPIRLAMGWYSTGLGKAPPLSVAVAYWMFGCYLMAVKRFAEYRRIAHPETAARYRSSFAFYTDERLLESIMFYAASFAMTSAIFMTRYCIELVLAVPLVAFSMAYYLHLGFKPDSPVQHPERLFHQKKLMALVMGTFVLCALLLFLDLPGFRGLFDPWITRGG